MEAKGKYQELLDSQFNMEDKELYDQHHYSPMHSGYNTPAHIQFNDMKSDRSSSSPHNFSDFPISSPPLENAEMQQGVYDVYNNTSSGSINPAELTLSLSSPPQGNCALQINPQSSPGMHQSGSDHYLSASSTQPSASGTFEWDSVLAQATSWGSHRRTPSEYSEISSAAISSAAQSPYLQNREYTEQPPSPTLQGQHYPDGSSMQELLNGSGDDLGLNAFTISEQNLSPRISPSPGVQSGANSPYLLPQDPHLLSYTQPIGIQMHPPPVDHGSGPATGLGLNSTGGEGLEDSFPQINISFAPPQRQPTFPGKPGMMADDSALGPPPRSPARRRSKSDPYARNSGLSINRSINSQSNSGSNSPAGGRSRRNSLSPEDALIAPIDRAINTTDRSTKMSRRSSTNSLPPDRNYILELAHPNRPGGTSGESKRIQKHPATFQCTLCPKRFTRAYNLRSHLRTHTDERPFVCTVCGKAFARQHDRKRHEGLHSGEKKFVCRGTLKIGGNWGCGRRFARADALGRHFRSEAGRVCIRPLLDEETAEKQRLHQIPDGQQQILDYCVSSDTLGNSRRMERSIPEFPRGLLEQYPDLANMTWGAQAEGGGGDEFETAGFDASGEEYDDVGGSVSSGSALNSNRNSFDNSRIWCGIEDSWVGENVERKHQIIHFD